MSARAALPVLIGLSPLLAMLAAFLIFPTPRARAPAFIEFMSLYICIGTLLLGFFGSLVLALRRRKPSWLIVTVASVAACGASFSIAFQNFSPGH